MAETKGKNIGDALAAISASLGNHLEKYGPLLLLLGFLEHDKNGKTIISPKVTSGAKAKIFGIGKDDEAITSGIIAKLSKNNVEKTQIILNWIDRCLKSFQRRQLRMWASQILEEFKEIPKDKSEPVGMEYAVDFLNLLANLPNHTERTKKALAMNIISKEPPLQDQVVKKVKKICKRIKPKKVLQNLNEAIEKELL